MLRRVALRAAHCVPLFVSIHRSTVSLELSLQSSKYRYVHTNSRKMYALVTAAYSRRRAAAAGAAAVAKRPDAVDVG
eukprot:COSAG05_NODE_830_length_7099_cov_10.124000_5_plen_77_part_00